MGYFSGSDTITNGKGQASSWRWRKENIDGVAIWYKTTLPQDQTYFDPQDDYYRIFPP
jgi:hypothetical protein